MRLSEIGTMHNIIRAKGEGGNINLTVPMTLTTFTQNFALYVYA